MRFLYSLIAILILTPSLGQPQRKVPVQPVSSWVKSYTYLNHVKDTANTSGGYFSLLIDNQDHAGKQESYVRRVRKVLSEKGLDNLSTISIDFDPAYESLAFHHIEILRDGKKIDLLRANQFEVLKRETELERSVYNGNLTAIFNVPQFQIGDVLDFAYTIKGFNPAFRDNFTRFYYLNHSVPVGQLRCRVLLPAEKPYQIKKFNGATDPQITRAGNYLAHEWSLDNVPAIVSEDATPGWHDPYDHIQISDYAGWTDLASKVTKLFGSTFQPNNLLKRIPELAGNDPGKSVERIIEFVQDDIRYLSMSGGIHDFKPHPPAQVLNQRYGDCKDKSVLLCALLNELGITSHPVLVNTDYGRSVPDYLPSHGLFNHCVVRINFHDSIFWIDPTISLQRGALRNRYFPSYYSGLVVGLQDPVMTDIPMSQRSTLLLEEFYRADSLGGSATLYVKTTYTSREADDARDYLKSNSRDDVEARYLNYYASDFPDIVKKKTFSWKDDPVANIVTSEEWYEVPNFWSYDSASAKYKAETYARTISSYLKKPSTKIRQTPYALHFPVDIYQKIQIVLPQPWSITTSNNLVEGKGFVYTSKIGFGATKDIAELEYRFRTTKSFLQPTEVKEHISKTDEALNDLSFYLSFSVPATKTPIKFNLPFSIMSIAVLILGFFLSRMALAYDPPFRATEQYTSIGGWLTLPVIGVWLTPLIIVFQLASGNSFNYGNWRMIVDSSFEAYNPALGLFVLAELLLNLLLIVFNVLLIVLLFKRRTSFPYLIVIYYCFHLLFIGCDVLVSVLFFDNSFGRSERMALLKSLLPAAIWIPYFLMSDRVKGTFVMQRDMNDKQQIFTMKK